MEQMTITAKIQIVVDETDKVLLEMCIRDRCGKLNHIVATALASVGPEKLEYHINSVPGMKGDDYIIETEVEEAGVKAVLNIYSRTAEIAGWSIVEVLQNAVSPIVF